MTRSIRRRVVALAALLSALSSVAVATERSEVPVKLTWDLTALYPSEDAWNAAREDITRRIPTLASFQGHLGVAPESLYTALSTMMGINRDLARLFTYASQLNDQDQRVSRHLEMKEGAQRLFVQFGSVSSYVHPEILAVGGNKVRSFIAADPRLKEYKPYLEDILRFEAHTLSAAEEKVAAEAGRMAGAGNTIRDPVQQRRDAVADGEAVDRRVGAARRRGLHPVPPVREHRRSRHRVPVLLACAPRLPGHVRRHAQRAGAVPHLRPQRAQVRELRRGRAVR
jgi:hypothetical protein